MVPPASRPDSRTGRYSGTLPRTAPVFSYRALTVSGAPFQGTSPDTLCNSAGPTTPIPQGDRFRLGPVRSPLLRPSRLISLPRGTEMFQFPRFAPSKTVTDQKSAGLPHSAIQGSVRVCRSPWLIAAYHGLRRLRVPRHPPHAFTRLTTKLVRAPRSGAFAPSLGVPQPESRQQARA